MATVKRLGFNALSVLSIVVFLATTALWIRTWAFQDLITFTRGNTLYRVHAKENGVVFARIEGWPRGAGLSWESARTGTAGLGVPVLFSSTKHTMLFGDIWLHRGTGAALVPTIDAAPVPVSGTLLVVPWSWFILPPLVPAAVFTAISLRRRHVRRRRRAGGLCAACGYDLRASIDRCPECGAAPAKA